jgi:DNA ligase-1
MRKKLLGKIVKYKYQEIGVLEKPRFPVFLGFRDKEDM